MKLSFNPNEISFAVVIWWRRHEILVCKWWCSQI